MSAVNRFIRVSRSTHSAAAWISVVLVALTTFPKISASAQNQMPPAAPSIDRSRADVVQAGANSAPIDAQARPVNAGASASAFIVRPRETRGPNEPYNNSQFKNQSYPQGQNRPQNLQAEVIKFDANAFAGQAAITPRLSGGQPLNATASYMAVTVPGELRSATVPAEVFHRWLVNAHPQFALNAAHISSGEVVEVSGHWDDAGKSLRKLGIPSTSISTGDLRSYPLQHVKVLIINCAGFVNRDCLQRARDFVLGGGYLLTTDWALDNVLQGAFPGYVSYNHKRNRHLEYVAQVTDPDPVLFKNTVSSANWKCETGCHLMTVLKPQLVRSIVHSRSLAGEDGEGVLAATFPFGHGQVLHLVGHFDNNQGMFRSGDTLPDPAPIIGIALRQAIASNFVVAGLSAVPIPSRQR